MQSDDANTPKPKPIVDQGNVIDTSGDVPGTGVARQNTPRLVNPIIAGLLVKGQVPLVKPPATTGFNGGPIPKSDWSYFTIYAQAKVVKQMAQPLLDLYGLTLEIVNGDSDNGFVLDTPPSDPPQDSDIAPWLLKAAMMSTDGLSDISLDDVVGDIMCRAIHPDQSDFSNGILGGPTLHLGSVTYGATTELTLYWNV